MGDGRDCQYFQPSPLYVVAERMSRPSIDQDEIQQWKKIGVYLIAKKAGVHDVRSVDGGPRSLLIVFNIANHPFDSDTISMRLLDTFQGRWTRYCKISQY